jgi:hypothetical protein
LWLSVLLGHLFVWAALYNIKRPRSSQAQDGGFLHVTNKQGRTSEEGEGDKHERCSAETREKGNRRKMIKTCVL